MKTLYSDSDWYVEEASVVGWGRNPKGTFYLVVERQLGEKQVPWHMNVPEMKLSNLPEILDSLTEEQRAQLVFTGGWRAGKASITVGLK